MWVSYTVLLPFWVISEAPVLLTPSGDRYWGTKVQRNLPNNNHFTLSSSLFTHDVWSVKLPMLMIIFKMVSLWGKSFFPSVSSLAVDATCLKLFLHSWNKNEENFAFIQLFYLFMFRQVVSGQMEQFICLLVTMFDATLQLTVFHMQPVNCSLWKSPEHSQKSRYIYKHTKYT